MRPLATRACGLTHTHSHTHTHTHTHTPGASAADAKRVREQGRKGPGEPDLARGVSCMRS